MLTNPKSSAFPWSGVIALVLLLLVIFLPLSALLSQAQNLDLLTMGQDAYLWHILQFSLLQAGLSGLISIFVGFWIARALFRRGQFWGHQWVLGLMGLPLVIPAIVVVLAMVATFGHQGLFPLGDNLYGLRGILLAHVFFNIPLAVRLLLPAWQGISAHYWQLGLELNFSSWDYFRHLEWPSLKGHIPRVFLLIFLLCFTSFAVVLGLGGGPQSATLEVAIYEALRFELDFAKGAVLALVQLFITGILAFWLVQWPQSQEQRHSGQLTLSPLRGWTDYPWILFAATLVLLPLGLLFADLFQQDLWQILGQDALVKASLTSISLALTAAAFALIWG
ncbi:MAG: thiamine/thiamine pyrophosphate ABC transporter permease ThiP, partial [Moraxella osloensis]|nr:thiamine/thiamine pyrophosphate ABC transporter permease ThiP [Moraxella osloensis]